MSNFEPIPGTLPCRKSLDSRRENEFEKDSANQTKDISQTSPRHIAAELMGELDKMTRRDYLQSIPTKFGSLFVRTLRVVENWRNEIRETVQKE